MRERERERERERDRERESKRERVINCFIRKRESCVCIREIKEIERERERERERLCKGVWKQVVRYILISAC